MNIRGFIARLWRWIWRDTDRDYSVIHKAQDSGRAKRVLTEIVVAGGYQAVGFRDGSLVYLKVDDGITEELFIRKIGDKDFQIIKRTIKGGNK